jgi:hypothetical protein
MANNTAIQQIECPKCQSVVDWPLRWAVNVAQEPALKERVLSWSIHLFVCPSCMTEVDLFSDFTYSDTQQGFVVMLWSGDDWDASSIDGSLAAMPEQERAGHLALVTRRVRTRNELVEKVAIFDSQLDDRVIELLKYTLQDEAPELSSLELRFAGAKDGHLNFIVIGGPENKPLDLPTGAYDQYVVALKPFKVPPLNFERWAEVNFEFAKGIMAQLRAVSVAVAQKN